MHEHNHHPVGGAGVAVMTSAAPAFPAEKRLAAVTAVWPPAPQSVGRARRLLAEHLVVRGLPELVDSAELIVSELAANAVTHAHPPFGNFTTRFEWLSSGVRIEVDDSGDGRPEPREASGDDVSGRGLFLVDALTGGRWGVIDRDGPGKCVWAVLEAQR